MARSSYSREHDLGANEGRRRRIGGPPTEESADSLPRVLHRVFISPGRSERRDRTPLGALITNLSRVGAKEWDSFKMRRRLPAAQGDRLRSRSSIPYHYLVRASGRRGGGGKDAFPERSELKTRVIGRATEACAELMCGVFSTHPCGDFYWRSIRLTESVRWR